MAPAAAHTPDDLRRHFRRHVRLYDATRWVVLHGRGRLLRTLRPAPGERVLEIGCGTGWLLRRIARAVGPAGRVVGVDLSEEMLARARRRCRGLSCVELRCDAFGPGSGPRGPFDAVVLSYSLSMAPEPEAVLRRVVDLLRPGGRLGVVDFLDATGAWGRWWFSRYPLRLGGRRDELHTLFQAEVDRVHRSWTGLWTFYLWLGRSPTGHCTPA